MLRIVLGILLLLGFLNSMGHPLPAESAEAFGYLSARIGTLILIGWLIYSGWKKKKAKKV